MTGGHISKTLTLPPWNSPQLVQANSWKDEKQDQYDLSEVKSEPVEAVAQFSATKSTKVEWEAGKPGPEEQRSEHLDSALLLTALSSWAIVQPLRTSSTKTVSWALFQCGRGNRLTPGKSQGHRRNLSRLSLENPQAVICLCVCMCDVYGVGCRHMHSTVCLWKAEDSC